jgi:hypothetical protein
MAIHSYSMPIRSYFLVIGPALAACLWFIGSALEPAPPPQVRTAGPAQAAKPAAPVPTASSARVTAGRAAPQPQGQDRIPAEPTSPADKTRAMSGEPRSAEGTRSPTPPEATSRSAEVAKHRKRKQAAQRRQHRDNYGPAYTERSPYAAYAAHYPYSPYYPPSQPFSGFGGR